MDGVLPSTPLGRNPADPSQRGDGRPGTASRGWAIAGTGVDQVDAEVRLDGSRSRQQPLESAALFMAGVTHRHT